MKNVDCIGSQKLINHIIFCPKLGGEIKEVVSPWISGRPGCEVADEGEGEVVGCLLDDVLQRNLGASDVELCAGRGSGIPPSDRKEGGADYMVELGIQNT